jgi:hypothetical protein
VKYGYKYIARNEFTLFFKMSIPIIIGIKINCYNPCPNSEVKFTDCIGKSLIIIEQIVNEILRWSVWGKINPMFTKVTLYSKSSPFSYNLLARLRGFLH